jgi:alpha-D-ribose 1-methylphosphonate 5-triphosphate synthase subunit PhnH
MFTPGDDCFPDRSATVIVQCAALDGGKAVELAGAGIRGVRRVAPTGIGSSFWNEIGANNARYPLGVDVILASGPEILCLPRSTRVVAGCGVSHAEGR